MPRIELDHFEVIHPGDQEKPEGEQRRFTYRHGTIGYWKAHHEELKRLDGLTIPEALEGMLTLAQRGLVDWSNTMTDPAGNQVPFRPDALADLLTPPQLYILVRDLPITALIEGLNQQAARKAAERAPVNTAT